MAQYQHLPIYKQTYDILLRTMTATKDFPREYKYTLGQKIKDELIELVVVIYRANSAAEAVLTSTPTPFTQSSTTTSSERPSCC